MRVKDKRILTCFNNTIILDLNIYVLWYMVRKINLPDLLQKNILKIWFPIKAVDALICKRKTMENKLNKIPKNIYIYIQSPKNGILWCLKWRWRSKNASVCPCIVICVCVVMSGVLHTLPPLSLVHRDLLCSGPGKALSSVIHCGCSEKKPVGRLERWLSS